MKTATDRPSEKRHSKPIREVRIPDLSIMPCPENIHGLWAGGPECTEEGQDVIDEDQVILVDDVKRHALW